MFVAATLAHTADPAAPSRAGIAAYLDSSASSLDDDGARRARLFALGLRATDTRPPPLAIEEIDLGRFVRADERRFAAGLIALETRRRRRSGDGPAAMRALTRLVALVRPAGMVGVLALTSVEDGADAALAAWRARPTDPDAQQEAIATQLRRAVSRETTERSDDDCTAAWTALVGLIGPVFVGNQAWRALAVRRASIYAVPPQDLAKTRETCEQRLADIFTELAKWHAARSGAQAKARIDRVRALLATEISVATSIDALRALADAEVCAAIPTTLGPCGLDLLGLRARAIGALSAIPPGSKAAPTAGAVRGILAGELAEAWSALHDGRIDLAEQLVQRADATEDALRLRAAICVCRMEDSPNELRALEIAVQWAAPRATQPARSGDKAALAGRHEAGAPRAEAMPEDLAIRIGEVALHVYGKYGLGRARRPLQAIRERHDTHTLREAEAELIRRHLARPDCDEADRIQRRVEILVLVPGDPARAALQREVTAALARASTADDVEAIIAVLRGATGGAEQLTGDLVFEAHLRQHELIDRHAAAQPDRELESVSLIEARVTELRQALDLARSRGGSQRRVIERLAALHERLAVLYGVAGKPQQAEQHRRRAAGYQRWLAPPRE